MTESDKALLRRFLDDNYSDEEYEQIKELLRKPEAQQALEEITRKDWESGARKHIPTQKLMDSWSDRLLTTIENGQQRTNRTFWKNSRSILNYAAVFIGLILIVGVPLYMFKMSNNKLAQVQHDDASVLPGADKALLTLADGSVMSLSDAEVGTIALQGGLEIEKREDGSISYKVKQQERTSQIAYNTITTPRGGQYSVILPDGSKVLLNAASSLTYPIHFADHERRVSMTGEAYFEIEKWKGSKGNKSVPFIVESEQQQVEVLGTKFNINAYKEEKAVETALVEGSVRVTSAISGKAVTLAPGQRSILREDITMQSADIHKQLAWTTGKFVFKEESLGNVLRQISRWYDLDIECPPQLESRQLTGIVSRSTPIDALVKTIESISKVKITNKERRLIVSE